MRLGAGMGITRHIYTSGARAGKAMIQIKLRVGAEVEVGSWRIMTTTRLHFTFVPSLKDDKRENERERERERGRKEEGRRRRRSRRRTKKLK